MKSIIKISIFLCIMISCLFLFTSCEKPTIEVEHIVSFDDKFAGDRTITLHFGEFLNGKDELKANLDKIIKEKSPTFFEHRIDDKNNELNYIFKIKFSSEKDYENKMGAILGSEVDVNLSTPNNALSKGWRYVEGFDGMKLLSFITEEAQKKEYKDLDIKFKYLSSVVNYNNKVEICDDTSSIDVNKVKGFPVTDIAIETTNNKKDSYDRKLTITFPQDTYDKMGEDIKILMRQRTDEIADYSGWTQKGNNQEFEVLYKGITLLQLQNVTSQFLDCDNEYVYYGDENNSSTPLAEQLVFEERLNNLSFVATKLSSVPISYKYSLPIRTTYGEGLVYYDGLWERQGKWVDGVYTLSNVNTSLCVRVPDGIQYKIDGIAVNTENLGKGKFVREFDFLYDRNTGVEGCNYANKFVQKLGAETYVSKNDTNLICSIRKEGTAQQIDKFFKNILGEQNTFERIENTSNMAVVTDLKLTDKTDISTILNEENMDISFKYTLKNSGVENIIFVEESNPDKNLSRVKATKNEDNEYVLELQGGENRVEIVSTIPYQEGVITYSIIAVIMLLLATGAIIFLIKKSKRLNIDAFKPRKVALIEDGDNGIENDENLEELQEHKNESEQKDKINKENLYKYYDNDDLL